MIHYHGTPVTPTSAAISLLSTRHGMVSFAHQGQMGLVAEVCQSFVLDNGAFTTWRSTRETINIPAYIDWVTKWSYHPGYDWHIIPDVIDGEEEINWQLAKDWNLPNGVPVWHLHESLDYLNWMVLQFRRIAIGSSGQWATPGSIDWWTRMEETREVVCDSQGRPRVKLHGLRMMNPTIYSQIPFASVDSCGVARNIGIDKKWDGHGYLKATTKQMRAQILADRFERHAVATIWEPRTQQMNMELLG